MFGVQSRKEALRALQQFTVSAYKDPLWKIATAIFIVLTPQLLFLLSAPLDRFLDAQQSLLLRSENWNREARTIQQVQDSVIAATRSERAVAEFINTFRGLATKKQEERCVELVDRARLDFVAASGAVEGTHVRNPALARVRDGSKETLQCIDYGLTRMKVMCQTRDFSKLDLLTRELFERSTECVAITTAQKQSYESEFAEDEGEFNRKLESETTSLSVLKRKIMLADCASLYEFGFIEAAVLGWLRRYKDNLRGS
jgi:hypothetical protein